MQFRLKQQTTLFNLTRRYVQQPSGIECVHGVTPDGKCQTVARVVNVRFLAPMVRTAGAGER